jgi:hypothetical protein
MIELGDHYAVNFNHSLLYFDKNFKHAGYGDYKDENG